MSEQPIIERLKHAAMADQYGARGPHADLCQQAAQAIADLRQMVDDQKENADRHFATCQRLLGEMLGRPPRDVSLESADEAVKGLRDLRTKLEAAEATCAAYEQVLRDVVVQGDDVDAAGWCEEVLRRENPGAPLLTELATLRETVEKMPKNGNGDVVSIGDVQWVGHLCDSPESGVVEAIHKVGDKIVVDLCRDDGTPFMRLLPIYKCWSAREAAEAARAAEQKKGGE